PPRAGSGLDRERRRGGPTAAHPERLARERRPGGDAGLPRPGGCSRLERVGVPERHGRAEPRPHRDGAWLTHGGIDPILDREDDDGRGDRGGGRAVRPRRLPRTHHLTRVRRNARRGRERVGMTVLVAMSGGVDSSLAAALLVEQGHRVIGATMKTFCYSEI